MTRLSCCGDLRTVRLRAHRSVQHRYIVIIGFNSRVPLRAIGVWLRGAYWAELTVLSCGELNRKRASKAVD